MIDKWSIKDSILKFCRVPFSTINHYTTKCRSKWTIWLNNFVAIPTYSPTNSKKKYAKLSNNREFTATVVKSWKKKRKEKKDCFMQVENTIPYASHDSFAYLQSRNRWLNVFAALLHKLQFVTTCPKRLATCICIDKTLFETFHEKNMNLCWHV